MKENRKAVGVVAKDVQTGQIFELRAKRVVCALGPWTNKSFKDDRRTVKHTVRTTKGIHLIYKGQIVKHAVVVQAKEDKRIFFVIPWMGNSLIGTTDTDFTGSPDDVKAEPEDIAYLIKEACRIFPSANLNEANLITAFAGLRPLVHEEGQPSKVSRRHQIEKSTSGVIYVMGGKYTTYRKIAEDCLKKFMYLKAKGPMEYPLYGSGAVTTAKEDIAAAYGIDEHAVEHLLNRYGARYQDVLDLTKKDPTLKQYLCVCSPAIKAEVIYAVKVEMAQTAEDIIERRLSLHYVPCASGQCRAFIGEILKTVLTKGTAA
jgi:glycerol-3-phosphate dehydrogenase